MQQAAFGGSFADNLGNAFGSQAGNLAMAAGFHAVGDWAATANGGQGYEPGSIQKVMAHALMGGALAEATGGDFKSGAMAAGVNEAMANALKDWAKGDPDFQLMESQIVGLLAATAVDGDVSKGAEVAKNATAYNSQDHDHDGDIDFQDELHEIRKRLGQESTLDAIEHGEPIPIVPNASTPTGALANGMMGRIAGGANSAKSGVPGSDFKPNPAVTAPYARPSGAGPTAAQRASVQGRPCVDCGATTSNQVADHIDPLVVQYYRDGAVNVPAQSSENAVQPHCPKCSAIQGGQLGAFGKAMRKFFGF